MIIKGQYTSTEIFTENIEEAALQWVREQCDHPAFEGVRIVQMPDVHAGNSCNVGTAYRIGTYLNPDHVGVDIGCTISMHRLSSVVASEDFALLDHKIRGVIPTGMEICEKNSLNEKELFRFLNSQYQRARSSAPDLINEVPRIDARFVSDFCRRIKLQEAIFYKSLGTLGGGNHFIEVGNCNGNYAFTVHCGSRNFGNKVCKYWEKVAASNQINNKVLKEKIKKLREITTNKKELPRLIEELKKSEAEKTCSNGYLSGDNMKAYLSDMVIAQAYAKYNHVVIGNIIGDILQKINGASIVETIQSIHNYVDISGDHMIRKGAIRAYEGEKMVVPFNMRDGLAICVGKSNSDWNCSCSHGAGRKLSRSKAKETLSMEEFEKEMENVYTTSVCRNTLDEAPMAYKETETIIDLIKDTCDILYLIKPIINIKATD